jgi:cytochrome c-type biogenesis protein CcmH
MSKNIVRNTHYALWITAFLVLFSAISVFAQGPTPSDDEVNAIAKELFCPVCESTPLDVCPTEACRQWRELIREMLADGKSEAEIKQYFVEHFGARVLNEPPNKLASYAVPVIAFLLGAFMLFRGFQMWMKPSKADIAPVGGPAVPESEAKSIPQDDYIARMEEELKKQK